MADKTMVDKEFPAFTWEVERGKIRELVQAIGDMNPIYVDRAAAIQAGYKDTPASATFITVPMMWSNTLIKVIKTLKINFSKVLHGEETYEYFQEIYPGDVLTGTIRVLSIEDKLGKSGGMDLIRLETLYKNQKDEPVLKAGTLLVERK
ncbi:MAG: MaoC family dehydratase N-terminal domain-containing protein [Syntrophales bacterium LBB04]|nr:MaoC family dehydratase N-terminal domain-containing protein [Syntrophales bacterium LBB04]